jgi:hypothetical protein
MDTYSQIYVSKLVAAPLSEYELVELLDRSRRRNACLHVTGILLKLDDYFLQLLEGREADVQQLFRRIADDRRHEILGVVGESAAPQRLFPDWPMGFRDLHRMVFTADGKSIRGDSLTGSDLLHNPQLCHRLLRELQAKMSFAPPPEVVRKLAIVGDRRSA